jgi:hypothetical protein
MKTVPSVGLRMEMRLLGALACCTLLPAMAAFSQSPIMHHPPPSAPLRAELRLALRGGSSAAPPVPAYARFGTDSATTPHTLQPQHHAPKRILFKQSQHCTTEAHALRRPIGRCVAAAILLVFMPCPPAFASSMSANAVLGVRQVSALVLACAAAGVWAEKHTRLGSVLSGARLPRFPTL